MSEAIGWAVKQMHNGSRVRRVGWNGKGMWLCLIKGGDWSLDHDRDPEHCISAMGRLSDTGYTRRSDFVAMKAADGTLVPWLCSQSDLLATDWEPAE